MGKKVPDKQMSGKDLFIISVYGVLICLAIILIGKGYSVLCGIFLPDWPRLASFCDTSGFGAIFLLLIGPVASYVLPVDVADKLSGVRQCG
jgi:hypothetical protein